MGCLIPSVLVLKGNVFFVSVLSLMFSLERSPVVILLVGKKACVGWRTMPALVPVPPRLPVLSLDE